MRNTSSKSMKHDMFTFLAKCLRNGKQEANLRILVRLKANGIERDSRYGTPPVPRSFRPHRPIARP